MTIYKSFTHATQHLNALLSTEAVLMHRGTWQGIDVQKKPEMGAYELNHQLIQVKLGPAMLDHYRDDIKPNLPWADDHFLERVGGNPLNPGKEWRNWPWGKNADKFRIDPEPLGDPTRELVFDHTYSQRYWPKFAGMYCGGIIDNARPDFRPHHGIYFDYGDLRDVINELANDPTTRQAVLPMFFPEDTGLRPGRRKPCSISYHFIINAKNEFDIFYHLRSCDFVRHFADDMYLTVRLHLWVLDRLREMSIRWQHIVPGWFNCYIGNLHIFRNDRTTPPPAPR